MAFSGMGVPLNMSGMYTYKINDLLEWLALRGHSLENRFSQSHLPV